MPLIAINLENLSSNRAVQMTCFGRRYFDSLAEGLGGVTAALSTKAVTHFATLDLPLNERSPSLAGCPTRHRLRIMAEGLNSHDLDAPSSDEIADDNWFSPTAKSTTHSTLKKTNLDYLNCSQESQRLLSNASLLTMLLLLRVEKRHETTKLFPTPLEIPRTARPFCQRSRLQCLQKPLGRPSIFRASERGSHPLG
jgi:hypothetical protein